MINIIAIITTITITTTTTTTAAIIVMRGELFSLSLGCRDTLNIFWGCFLSFLRSVSAALLLLFGCQYCNIFLGGALSSLKACTLLAPF